MKILVLVKPVPDPEKYNELKIDPVTKRLVREGVPTVVNPTDRNALELALQIRGAAAKTAAIEATVADVANCLDEPVRVTVLSMAPEFCAGKLVECLAMGADDAYLLSDRVFGGADTYVTSYVLAEAVKRIGYDLILAGNESADGATSHVPTQVAEWLGIAHICNVCSVEYDINENADDCCGGLLKVCKRSEDAMLNFEGTPPAVIAVTGDINKPRYINAMGIIKAKKKPLTIWSNEDLQLDEARLGMNGSPTQAGELVEVDMSRNGQPLVGEKTSGCGCFAGDSRGSSSKGFDGNSAVGGVADKPTAGEAAQAILSIIKKAGVQV